MAINWGLGLNYPDAGQALTQGLRSGATSGALNALLANPNDPNIAQRLAPFNPEGAMQIHSQQQAQQAAQAEREIRMRAAQGDPNARNQLAGIDWNAWSKLDEATRKQAGEAIDFIGQAALQINSLRDENERAAAWSEYVRQAEARGMDIPAEYEQYSPGVLQAALAETKLIKEQLAQNEPKYLTPAADQDLVNVRDPQAVAAFQASRQARAAGVPYTSPQTPQSGGVPQGNPLTPPQPDQNATRAAERVFADAMASKIITPENLKVLLSGFEPGPNGERRVMEMLRGANIQVGKQINGKTYVQRGGEWYEVN